MNLVIANAEISGRGGRGDVRITDGVITEIAVGLSPSRGEERIDAAGGALLPGLHDHHVHLRAMAAARLSVPAGPPAVTDAACLAKRLSAAAGTTPGGWIRAVGYHESVAGPLDRGVLDTMVPDRPLRVQHRSGALWIFNSQALARAGIAEMDRPGIERDQAGAPTGRLWRADRWLAPLLPGEPVDLAPVSATGVEAGVTGYTEATPDLSPEEIEGFAAALASGRLRQRLHLMCPPGAPVPAVAGLTAGTVKVLLDDDPPPDLDALVATARSAHRQDRGVAVHCVTRLQLVVTLAALRSAGVHPQDRIEHAAVVPATLIDELAGLGLTVVTQPNFVAERGDQYRAEVEATDLPDLYRCRSLLAAGVGTAFGTDAPFGDADPWAAMRAAVSRRTGRGDVLGRAERVSGGRALRAFLGHAHDPGRARRVELGAPADLCLLRVPRRVAMAELSASCVALTLVGGEVVADQR